MDFTNTNGIVTQSIIETCEHCDEVVRTIHISEIAVKAPNDPRTIRIKDKSDSLVFMKEKNERLAEITGSYIKKGLLDDVEAAEAKRDPKGMKYGLRAEAMCSESIDIDGEVTRSFCYRVAANPADARFQKVVGGLTLSASLATAEKTDVTGSRMGVDRKGRVIKMNRYKNLRMDKKIGQEEVEKDGSNREIERKKGPYATAWFEALSQENRERVIESSQACARLIDTYGEEVRDMTVVARASSLADYQRNYIERAGCRL